MAHNKSKAKGSAYEQKIAARLSSEFGKEFRRVPLSGAIDYLKGDIWTPHDTAWWPYAIECKHYKNIEWNNLLTSKTGTVAVDKFPFIPNSFEIELFIL